jgi:transcriptional regulator with XRE-family HTH domain
MSASEGILEALRTAMVAQGLNSAALAKAMGEDRKGLRRALAGQTDMSLESLCKALDVLGLRGEDLAWKAPSLPAPEPPALQSAEEAMQVDPYGIQGEQAFRLAFSLGVDFLLVADASQLSESGIPGKVLEQWPEEIVLKLDAAYHHHNAPRFTPEGVALKLSFDDLYDCFLPWSAIKKVIFHLETPEPEQEDKTPPSGPGLRLVKG